MILKLNNKSENFYNYLGRFFGSRIVELTTQDRIYDDNNKDWYIYTQNNIVTAIVSIANTKIKNIYTTNTTHLSTLLTALNKDVKISSSTVTNVYQDIYEKCNFKVLDCGYKNFVKIWSNENE